MNSFYLPYRRPHRGVGRLFAAALFLALIAGGFAQAVDQMPPPHPDASLVGPKKRQLLLEIKFDEKGHVASCEPLKSSGAAKLDKDTIAFITKNWIVASEAGKTVHLPLDFQPATPKPMAKANTNAAPVSASSPGYDPARQGIGGGYGGASGGGNSGGYPGGAAH